MPYKNIDPNLWGSPLWTFLHYLSLSYPENPTTDEQEIIYNFLASMQKIIPCEKCRNNFLKHLDSMEVEVLTSRTNFVRWLFNIHNLVNKDTGKPNFSYDEFIKKYSQEKVDVETNKINSEYSDLVEKNKKLELFIEILQNSNSNKNKEHFNLSPNVFIFVMIIIVIIVIVVMNRKS